MQLQFTDRPKSLRTLLRKEDRALKGRLAIDGVRIGHKVLADAFPPGLYWLLMSLSLMSRPVRVRLEKLLFERDVKAGFACLDQFFLRRRTLEDTSAEAIALLYCVAQWVDLGYRDRAFFEEVFAPFVSLDRLMLPFESVLQLMLVDAFRLAQTWSFPAAVAVLASALTSGGDIMPMHMVFVARFLKGRAHRREGDFKQAMAEICAARGLAERLNARKLVAVTKIHESWLVFHQGDRRLAFQLLTEAEEVLGPAGHALSLGNIASARGRFVRSAGDYVSALHFFEQAIEIYERDYPTHPNLGRALVNAAYVKRLMALELHPGGRGEPAGASVHAKTFEITSQAMELLRRASVIYSINPLDASSAAVSVSMGHLLLERGEIEQAGLEAAAACGAGDATQNHALLARAHILQTYVALASSEEELETREGESYARKAAQHAQEALSSARFTQNRRLLASAHIARGMAAADPFYADWETAKEHAAKADQLLGQEERDHLFRELDTLKRNIMRSVRVDEVFRRWAAGDLGGKTFQQTETEFAEIVIPRVWLNLSRNISLVAQELRISPKKVRRVLKSARYT